MFVRQFAVAGFTDIKVAGPIAKYSTVAEKFNGNHAQIASC
jgi:hypothetical protein